MSKVFKSLLITALTSIALASCTNPVEPEPDVEIVCEVESYYILGNTPIATPVYKFTSNVEGPRVALVGGIHGDEVAGWNAAKRLLKNPNFKGEVLLIPYANITADLVVNRWPGRGDGNKVSSALVNSKLRSTTNEDFAEIYQNRDISMIGEYTFADLNRSFPGNPNGTITEKLANAIYNEVISFNPDYCVDFHESLHTHYQLKGDATYLGDLIIYGGYQSSSIAMDIADTFNEKYLLDGENEFEYYEATVIGSFCNVMGSALPKAKVFTWETNRENDGTNDTANLERRIEQQLQLTSVMFDFAYEDYAKSK